MPIEIINGIIEITKKAKKYKSRKILVSLREEEIDWWIGALTQEDFSAPKVDLDKCIRCGKCSNFCPKKALVLE